MRSPAVQSVEGWEGRDEARRHTPRRIAMRALAAGYVGLLVVAPLVALGEAALGAGPGTLWRVLAAPGVRAALGLSLGAALAAALVNAAAGLLTAYVLARCEFPGRRLANGLADLPAFLPPFAVGVAAALLFGSRGGLLPILAALLVVTYPPALRSVQAVMQASDRDVEDAARALGAREGALVRRILLPTVLPAAVSGAVAAFARAAGEMGAVVFVLGLAGEREGGAATIATLLGGALRAGDRDGAVAAAFLLAAVAGACAIAGRLSGGERWLAAARRRPGGAA